MNKTLRKVLKYNNNMLFYMPKNKKAIIDQDLHKQVWEKYNGDKSCVKCPCCEIFDIHYASHECGHIVAEANGGATTIDNLIPICSLCNKSMHTTNYYEFKEFLDGQKEVDPKHLPKMIKTKIWYKHYKLNMNGKCLCCKKATIANDDFYTAIRTKNEKDGSYVIQNMLPICKKCHMLLKNNKWDDVADNDNHCCCVLWFLSY